MLNLESEYDRLKTFVNLNLDTAKCRQFARSGFFYTNCDDIIKCYFCALNLNAFTAPSNIEPEHQYLSPNCVYAGGKDVCGLYDRPVIKKNTSKLQKYRGIVFKALGGVFLITGIICGIYCAVVYFRNQ